MAGKVLLHPRLEKQLRAMEGRANAPFIAAGRARRIIGAVIKGQTSRAAGLFRARSDTRVKNAWKYDLGAGYRLICIRTKQIIYVMYAGDHESCDAWLNNNSKKQPRISETEMTAFTIRDSPEPFDCRTGRDLEPDFDDQHPAPIPQAYLRKVFCGLVAG